MNSNPYSNLKIQNILASIFLLFSPVLIIIFEFTQIKFKKKLILLSFLLAFIFWCGRDNFSGESVSNFYLIYIFTIRIFWINFLSRNNIYKRQSKILVVSKVLLGYILLSFLFTFLTNTNLVEERKLSLIFSSNYENSTNYVNILLMILVILLFSKIRLMFFFISFIIFLLSITWQNRTGIILTPVIVIFRLLLNKKYLLSFFLFIFILFNFKSFLNFSSRFSTLGLDTERTIIVVDAFNQLINGNYFFGGYKVSNNSTLVDQTNWTHNLILDAFRLAGVPGVIISILLLLISFIKNFNKDSNFILGLFCWFIGFILSMTSVVLESTLYEFLFIFILLFNFYFFEKNKNNIKG
jgi:hypothetical protein